MLKATRNSLEDFDRVFAFLRHAVPAIQPRRNSQNDNDERVSECGDEEEEALSPRVSPSEVVASHPDGIQEKESNESKRRILLSCWQELEGVDDDLVGGGASTMKH